MPKSKRTTKDDEDIGIKPALTPEGEENQMIALAMAQAKRQLMEGTASSQVLTHFLKLGSTKERLEREKLEEENKLLRAKTEALQAAKDSGKMFEEAMRAFSEYSGNGDAEYDY